MWKNDWYIILIIILLALNINYAQDSLHLIMTLEGQTEEPISNINGIGDINADGYDDFIISSLESNVCKIFLGNNRKNFHPKLLIVPPDTLPNILEFGGYFEKIGDINNDNFDDFLIAGLFAYPLQKGYLVLYLGGDIVDSTEDFIYFNKTFLSDFYGLSFDSGDINGDGFNDLVISNPYNWTTGNGEVEIYYGENTTPTEPSIIFTHRRGYKDNFFGDQIKILNLNGDNYNDMLLSSIPIPDEDSSKVYIYIGQKDFNEKPIDSLLFSNNFLKLTVLDFNGDGFDDFYVGTTKRLYFGGTEFNKNSFITFENKSPSNSFGWEGAGIGDINNDGFEDLIIGEKDHLNNVGIMVGGAYIFLGGLTPDTEPDYFLEGSTKWGEFGRIFGDLGDFNKDGFNEFFTFEPGYPDYEHPKGKIYIYSMKKFIVDVEDENNYILSEYKLSQNYPNPFNPSTIISYQIPEESFVTLKVYDILGREVATLVNEEKAAGTYNYQFSINNPTADGSLSSGVYFYQLKTGAFSETRKMILLR